jgi:hypothetical protein
MLRPRQGLLSIRSSALGVPSEGLVYHLGEGSLDRTTNAARTSIPLGWLQ